MMKTKIKKILSSLPDSLYLILFLLVGTVFFWIYTSVLPVHVLSLAPQFAFMSIGLTLITICGEIDFSVGSVYFLAPALLWSLWKVIHIPEVAFILTLGICCLIGLANGFIVTRFKAPSMIVTLGMLYILRSLVVFVTGGRPVVLSKRSFSFLYTILTGSSVGPHHFLWAVFFAVIFWILLNRTRFGNWVLFTGGNERAASDCGINTSRVKTICFILCSSMAALGGIIGSFRAGMVDPSPNELNVLLICMAGVFIGGTSIFGGKGSMFGSILGIFCIILLQSVFGALGIGAWYKVLLGLMIVVIVTGQALGWYRRERST